MIVLAHSFAAEHELWLSPDGGDTWRQLQPPNTARINVLNLQGGSLFAGTDRGLFVSENYAQTWRQPAEFANARVLALARAGTNLLVGTATGLSIASNRAEAVRKPPALAGTVLSVAWNGTNAFVGLNSGDVLVSANLVDWGSIASGLPQNSQIFELRAPPGGPLYAALYSSGFWRWDGTRWQQLGEVRPLTMLATESLLLVGHNPGGLYRSLDQGETWQPITSGLPINAPSWTLHSSGNRYFYGTSGQSGLYLSDDQAATWKPVNPGIFRATGVVAITSEQQVLIVATVTAKLRPGIASGELLEPLPLEVPN